MSPEARAELRPSNRPIFLQRSSNTGFVLGILLGLVALVLVKVMWWWT